MTTELAIQPVEEVIDHRAPVTLFGTDNPAAVVERASNVATSLASVINERHLFASINGKKHVQVEGWTLLGSMLGVFAEVEWSRPLEDGWEARAVARTLNGNVVGAAEAMCTVREGRWRNADTYAVRSMAQTRAVSKALRMPLGFIMHLAGYEATPAEEVPADQPERQNGAPTGRRAPAPAPASSTPRNKGEAASMLLEIAKERSPSKPLEWLEAQAKEAGVKRGEATLEELIVLIAVLRSGTSYETSDTPESGVSPETPASVDTGASAPHAGAPPPQPGTDAYRLLPSGSERAVAKAYWDAHKDTEPTQETMAEALGAPAA